MNKEQTSSSLDLLLDAMSNAFGSIVLICILLIINLSSKTEEIQEKVESDFSQGQLSEYIAAKESIDLENAAIIEEIESLEVYDMQALISEQAELEIELKEALEKHSKKISALKTALSSPKKIKTVDSSAFVAKSKELDAINSRLIKVEKDKKQAMNDLINLKANSQRISVAAGLKKEKIRNYIWVIIQDDYIKALDDFNDKTSLKEGIDGNKYVLLDSSNAMSITEFSNFLERLNYNNTYLSFIVEHNSISYSKLREAIMVSTKKGFSYHWHPKFRYLSSFGSNGYTPDGTY